ncbi:MAG TPA: DUF2188 domain-containing protein [Candidatus Thermoplasmatota archaeon]|nr:DUF2188 domain-containing protein [Candidatus Thermoplasmatota archaeon]
MAMTPDSASMTCVPGAAPPGLRLGTPVSRPIPTTETSAGSVFAKVAGSRAFHVGQARTLVPGVTFEVRGLLLSKDRDRTVARRPDGTWENKRHDAERPSTVHPTQGEAAARAKEMLRNQGGGELTVKGRDGKIRSNETVAPGNDPNPPRDKEH